MTLAVAARPATLSRAGLRRVLATLCVTEITSWGVLYYAFPVLAPAISTATGWPATWVVGAFSVSQLVAALVGIPVGRWLDRRGPHLIMTAGSVLAVPAALGVGAAPNLAWFFVAWILAGAAMGAVLYPPAFAALTPARHRDHGSLGSGALRAADRTGVRPVTITMALAPWAGAAIAEWLGAYFSMFFVLAAVNAVGVVLALWATPGFRSPPEHLSGAAVHA